MLQIGAGITNMGNLSQIGVQKRKLKTKLLFKSFRKLSDRNSELEL